MNREGIIRLAIDYTISGLKFDEDGLIRFAHLIAQHEREECAKVCEKIASDFLSWPESFEGLTAETKLMRSLGEFVHKPFTEAIRARGNA